MSETPCQPSQQENGHIVTDPADIATETATSNPEQDTTASKREEVSQFSPHARSAEGLGAMNRTETAPDATQSEDSSPCATTTLPQQTPAEKAVSSAMQAREAMNQWAKDYGEAAWKAEDRTPVNLDTVMRRCGQADESAPATGTEALVCADIAKRQRRGLAKYGKTVIANNLSFAQWLQHFYEELLDGAIYAKRILTQMNHEPENETDSDAGASGVLPDNANTLNRHRKPGAGRKAKPCPGCGAVKSIGSTVKNGIPTRRCKQCGFVVRQYHHLANGKTAAEMA